MKFQLMTETRQNNLLMFRFVLIEWLRGGCARIRSVELTHFAKPCCFVFYELLEVFLERPSHCISRSLCTFCTM